MAAELWSWCRKLVTEWINILLCNVNHEIVYVYRYFGIMVEYCVVLQRIGVDAIIPLGLSNFVRNNFV